MDKRLSVAIITYNEELNIKRTLLAVNDIADEIIIVDSFSTDNTEAVCREFEKVRFVKRKWEGVGNQKNFTLSLCTCPWVLFIDADEEIGSVAKQAIEQIIQDKKPPINGQVYSLKLENYIFGKLVRYGGWGSVWRNRFFFRGSGKFSQDIVHEKFITDKVAKKLPGSAKHHTYNSVFHQIEKMNVYTEDMSVKMFKSGRKSSIMLMLFSPFFRFINTYVVRLGFLDGFLGFYLSILGAIYTFLKYFKLYNLQQK